jgi:hypothetical protein
MEFVTRSISEGSWAGGHDDFLLAAFRIAVFLAGNVEFSDSLLEC